MDILVTTLISVIVSLAVSLGIFVGFNRLIDQTQDNWPVFRAGLGGIVGLVVGAIVQHNGWLKIGGDLGGPLQNGWLTILLGGAVGAAVGYAIGAAHVPDLSQRLKSEGRWRPVAFVGPAILFVGMGLILPSIRTMILSLKEGNRGEGNLSLTNYERIFRDDNFFNVDGWTNIFTSRLMIVGLLAILFAGMAAWASTQEILGGRNAEIGALFTRIILVVLGGGFALAFIGLIEGIIREPNQSWIYDNILTPVVSSRVTLLIVLALLMVAIGAWLVQRNSDPTSATLDWGTPTSSLMAVGATIVILLAIFSTLQSVLWNNIWWAVTVTGMCTVFGLGLAILADRSKGEKVARTMIFLPMAISMVGAAVIWDFMYERSATGAQTGLINAILQGLGFQPRGFFINASMIPWNNFWIMLILVWIQTGFSMVVLSSAIKGVPTELVEAARVDGAGEVQIFWRVIIPQIRSTIIVVITTLLIITMKIFDLVKATTGGSQRTNVLANEMFDQLRDRNFALSSAFAVTIFALTLPVMIYNVRKTQRELS